MVFVHVVVEVYVGNSSVTATWGVGVRAGLRARVRGVDVGVRVDWALVLRVLALLTLTLQPQSRWLQLILNAKLRVGRIDCPGVSAVVVIDGLGVFVRIVFRIIS